MATMTRMGMRELRDNLTRTVTMASPVLFNDLRLAEALQTAGLRVAAPGR